MGRIIYRAAGTLLMFLALNGGSVNKEPMDAEPYSEKNMRNYRVFMAQYPVNGTKATFYEFSDSLNEVIIDSADKKSIVDRNSHDFARWSDEYRHIKRALNESTKPARIRR